jgi:hypothetical protein
MRTLSIVILSSIVLSGCAAGWGAAHDVKFADENKFVIQYDRALTSSVRTQALAAEHCAKYNRVPKAVDAKMPGILLGIIEETYDCVEG